MNRYYIVAIAVVVLAIGLGLVFYEGDSSVVATVNGSPVLRAELEKALSSKFAMHRGTGADVDSEKLRDSVLEQLISEQLILQGALEAGVDVTDAEVMAELDARKDISGEEAYRKFLADNGYTEASYSQLLREKMIKNRFVAGVLAYGEVTEEEMRSFYKESPMPMMKPESVEVRIVEFPAMPEARAAFERMGKEGFDKVADGLREGGAAFVSEYGETSPSYYPGEVGSAMKELSEGAFGGPFQGKDGVFIVRVKKRTPETPKSFEEAREDIRAMLMERRTSGSLIHWLAEKRSNSTIVRK